MSAPYVDTSARAKWYLNEASSDAFEAYIGEYAIAAISWLTVIELRCLLARRRRAKELPRATEQATFDLFQTDVRAGYLEIHPLRDDHAATAVGLLDRLPKHPLRTLDALHLAIAEAIGAAQIATADRTMASAARALGFDVVAFA